MLKDIHTIIFIQEGETPLFCASLKGHVEVVKLLLERNAAVDLCNQVCKYYSYYTFWSAVASLQG